MAKYVIASKLTHDLVCDTGDLNYTPDPIRHRYGASDRPPWENTYLEALELINNHYPEHEIFFGPNLAFGEKFATYLTRCEVEIKPDSFKELNRAVWDSDIAIRRKVGALWEWGGCLTFGERGDRAALIIAWLDFAYFVQHRKDFLDARHNRFMADFASGNPQSTDYKVLHDGTPVEFDPQLLEEDEREVFMRASEVRFEVVDRCAQLEEPRPLDMV